MSFFPILDVNIETRDLVFELLAAMTLITCVVAWRVYASIPRERSKKKPPHKERLKKFISAPQTVKSFLLIEAAVIVGTLCGYFGRGEDPNAAADYVAFAFPCVAGIAAGAGLLTPRKVYRKGKRVYVPLFSNRDFRWYFISVIAIGIGYCGYLSKAKTEGPFTFALISMIIVAVASLFFRRSIGRRSNAEAIVDTIVYPIIALVLALTASIVVVSAFKKFS